MQLKIDRRAFIATLGGAAAVKAMSHEASANALEEYQMEQLNQEVAKETDKQQGESEKYPSVAEIGAKIETRPYRLGVGNLFVAGGRDGAGDSPSSKNVRKLPKMPAKPTIIDFFKLRFYPSSHVLQSANRAMKVGMSEELILACLLHDTVHTLIKTDHGWWGAQLYEPYVSEKVAFAIRYHQALRFYPDSEAGYEYPDSYLQIFGVDYEPQPYIEATYKMLKNHKWYMLPRLVTVNDLYSFDPKVTVPVEQFTDVIGRHFKQPKEGLGYDNSPVAHMWRTMINPDIRL